MNCSLWHSLAAGSGLRAQRFATIRSAAVQIKVREKIFFSFPVSMIEGTIPLMRDHTKLQAFQMADGLALGIYTATTGFPKHELFGLAQQLRRAAVSCVSNIVEGCARNSQADYLRFLDMAYGSACEIEYQLSLAERLAYLTPEQADSLSDTCRRTAKLLNALIRSLRISDPGA